jgi:hypothetical protein
MVDNELSPSTAKKREAPPAEQGRTKRAKERGEDDAEARAQIPEERDEEAPAGVGNKAAEQRKTTGGDAQDEQVRRLAAGDAAAATQDSRGGCDSGPCGGEGVPEEMPQRMDLPMVEVLPMVHFQMDSVKPVSGAGAQAAGPSLAKAWPKRCFAKSGGPTTNRAAAQLQCPKCAHAYDTQTAPPLLLPCLHSLCSPCAAADQLRICPQCDFPYEFFSPVASSSEVWGGGERVLLACENKALVEKCSVMAILWGGTVQCGECKAECGDQGAFCAECHTFLCCFCSAHHRRALITKAHTIKTMDQVKCLIHRQTLDQVTCPLHRQGGAPPPRPPPRPRPTSLGLKCGRGSCAKRILTLRLICIVCTASWCSAANAPWWHTTRLRTRWRCRRRVLATMYRGSSATASALWRRTTLALTMLYRR